MDRDEDGGTGMRTSRPRDRRGFAVGVAFGASVLASIGLTIVYIAGGEPQVEGALLLVALGGIGVGLIWWAKRFLPVGVDVQEREPLPSTPAERASASDAFGAGAELVGRRRVLVRLLAVALGALGLAALFPIRSLGRAPGGALFRTGWRAGVRAVDGAGMLVAAARVTPGTILTVFPEGHIGAADSQTLLIGLGPGVYRRPPGREDWAPEGIIAYSKICTHVGCPVGLYQPSEHRLFCPCHQSAFDVLDGARPVAGPAARPLPQLPLSIDEDGFIVARGDFPEPVGPGFWERGRG
jgi:ubiquinol-cytochrome c reductase iron-sulfur subunit